MFSRLATGARTQYRRNLCSQPPPAAAPTQPAPPKGKWLKRGLIGSLLGEFHFTRASPPSAGSVYFLDYIINDDLEILKDKWRKKLSPEETKERAKVVILGTGSSLITFI